MRNRFGVKDFVVLLLVAVVGVMTLMSMVQSDRQWVQLRDVRTKLEDLERRVGTGGVVMAPGAGASAGSGLGQARRGPAPRREDWAKPGVPIAWQPERSYDTDPTTMEGFAEGGEVVSLFNAQAATVMPLIYKDVYGAWVFEEVTEYLAEWDPKTLELRGILAQAWQYAPDGTWLRVHIHPWAQFSDGKPVTAADVIWTFNFMRNPQVQAERPRSITDFIVEIVEVDERTVEFRFNKVLFTNLSAAMGTFPILPKHFYETFTPTQFNQATGLVMGSGPFKFETLDPARQWSPGQDVVLVRNEQFWGPKPPFERLRFKFINQDLPRVTAFNNGEGDINIPSTAQFHQFSQQEAWKERNDARKWFNIRGGYTFIGWNCGLRNGRPTPFADKRVRRAMTMILDRELIVEEILYGLGRVASGPFNSVTAQANPNIRPWPYDLSAARELLKEAGWEDRNGDGTLEDKDGKPFEFEFTYPSGNEATERLVKYTKDQAAKVGIRATLRPMDWSVFMSTMDNRDFDALTLSWSPASPESDPQQIWHSRFIQNQGDNFVQWASAEADEVIEKGRLELDPAKRMEYWHRLHAILHDEQPYTFVAERPWLRFVNKRLGNFSEYRNGFKYDELFVRRGGGSGRMN